MNYYNDNDPYAAAWLRELIRGEHIPDGFVDERSIVALQPADLKHYSQCHFFAGIGGWPYALKLAGIPDDRPLWTASCPCQPFSSAGKQLGDKDPRHLWPDLYRLIDQCRPAAIFGEQVASKAGRAWLSGVRLDLERVGYAVGASDLPAASVGAPHIRQRLYWMAYANRGQPGHGRLQPGREHGQQPENAGAGGVDKSDSDRGEAGISGQVPGQEGHAGVADYAGDQADAREREREREREVVWLGQSEQSGLERHSWHVAYRHEPRWLNSEAARSVGETGQPCFWSPAELIACTDGTKRRIKPGLRPLDARLPGRVAILRGAGNSIVPQLAAEFIQAAEEAVKLLYEQ